MEGKTKIKIAVATCLLLGLVYLLTRGKDLPPPPPEQRSSPPEQPSPPSEPSYDPRIPPAACFRYDADHNHYPCLRQGHTAHWALICGVLLINDPGPSYTSDPGNTHVFARHGKSRYVAAWRLDDLERSNRNLNNFSPKKENDGLLYIMPDGGLGGENGLRNQFLIFEDS